MRILSIEDELAMAEAVASVLKKNNYTVDCVHDGELGLDSAESGIYDVIILDIMLPKLDGIEILKRIRENDLMTPVILVSAKSELKDKVIGLDSGADDYLPKPYKMEELLARLRALGRRKGQVLRSEVITYGDLEFNPHTLDLYCGKNSFLLTLKEGLLLELLMNHNQRTSSKSQIIEKLWGFDGEGSDNNVEVYIYHLYVKYLSSSSLKLPFKH